jgi:hypothetical protein
MFCTTKILHQAGSHSLRSRLSSITATCCSATRTKRFFSLHAFAEMKPVGTMTKVVCTLGPSTDSQEMIGQRKYKRIRRFLLDSR